MANRRMLIRIVFVIFFANEIDCLGGVCDDCCDCFKEKENITTESLVNKGWYNAKKEKSVLMNFKKEDDNGIFTSEVDGDKISFKFDEKDNSKIVYQNETENENENEHKFKDPLNLKGEKYALFEIKTKGKNTAYLYCSDVESSEDELLVYGIFEKMNHKSISVIACDTTNVTNMGYMFSGCSSLKDLNIKNFNTENVTNMRGMFNGCSRLKNLDISNFNTTKVTDMGYMFHNCNSLQILDLKNFDTTNVTDMNRMFSECTFLGKLEIGKNFNTKNVTDMSNMFDGCNKLIDDVRYEILKKK